MKFDKRDFFVLGFSAGVFISLVLFLTINFIVNTPMKIGSVVSPNSCMNKSMYDSSNCALKYVEKFYKFNISNVGRTMTLTELKKEGGVCSHYSKVYDLIGKEAGFYTTEVTIWNTPKDRHVFSVWSNEEGYVILDQTNREFFPLDIETDGD